MRADGKRLRNTDPMYTIVPHIMPERNDTLNAITIDIPLEPISEYIKEQREKGNNFSHMDIIIAAYVRTVAEFPALNRFIMNKNIYARTELPVGMVVLKEGGDVNEETMSKMYFDVKDTIFDVHNTIEEFVSENRKHTSSNSTDKIIKSLLSIPGLLRVGVNLFKFMDKHNLLPGSIIDASPFHTSMVISNLASIRTNHIYHHCYNFGNTGMIVTMGNSREVPIRKGKEIEFVKCMPLGIVMDERLCSGAQLSVVFRRFKRYTVNPKLLEEAPTEVKYDVVYDGRQGRHAKKEK